ncbi:hypothetical protein ACEPAG_8478 [Sanghuangporus baumii]
MTLHWTLQSKPGQAQRPLSTDRTDHNRAQRRQLLPGHADIPPELGSGPTPVASSAFSSGSGKTSHAQPQVQVLE